MLEHVDCDLINFEELEVSVQIAQSGSFSAAGRRLDLSPSAVSKTVSRLEQHFGARLFNRTTQSIRLSEEGEALLQRAFRVLEAMQDADRLIDQFSDSPRGQLRVYSLSSFALVRSYDWRKFLGNRRDLTAA